MSISEVVDYEYRLMPADLGGKPRRVMIANVTYQGIEEMIPVLHFAGERKRLALTGVLAQELTTVTATSLRSAWIGREIILLPTQGSDGPAISIHPPDGRRARAFIPVRRTADEHGWRMALAIVAVLLIVAAAYTYVFLPQLQASLLELRSLFP